MSPNETPCKKTVVIKSVSKWAPEKFLATKFKLGKGLFPGRQTLPFPVANWLEKNLNFDPES